MKSGGNTQGFTIVETLIFLGVSAVIMVSVLSLVGGSQNKAQFQQSVYDTDQQINDVIENVANGYYNKVGNLNCTDNGFGSVSLRDNTDTDIGSSEECIFIGRVIQFAVAGKPDNIAVYDLVGLRQKTGSEVKTLADANPRLIAKGSSSQTSSFPADKSEKKTLKGGLSAEYLRYEDGAATKNAGGIAILSNLAENSSSGNIKSSSQQISVYVIKGSSLGISSTDFVDLANDPSNYKSLGNKGAEICFNSGTTNQSVLITLGANSETNRTTTTINSDKCI